MTFHAYLLHLAAKVALVLLVAGGLILSDRGKNEAYPFGYYFNLGCYAVTPFVLSALVRGTVNSSIAIWISYGVSLVLVLSLALSGLARCKQEDARELQSEKQPAIWQKGKL